jgi:ketosteroid isomerase-like protein
MLSESVEVVIRFVTAINSRNINSISELISEDHKFTDSLGNVFRGKEIMKKGWSDYLNLFPDYKIEIDESLMIKIRLFLLAKRAALIILP